MKTPGGTYGLDPLGPKRKSRFPGCAFAFLGCAFAFPEIGTMVYTAVYMHACTGVVHVQRMYYMCWHDVCRQVVIYAQLHTPLRRTVHACDRGLVRFQQRTYLPIRPRHAKR